MSDLRLVPIDLSTARKFIATHHRHNRPPQGWKWGVGVADDTGELVGVAVAGRPVARHSDTGTTLEITRTCTTGEPNANSMLYGAIGRAAKALGYSELITYILADEPGTSLKAAGWAPDAELPERESWSCRVRHRYDENLFGEPSRPTGPKVRWKRVLHVA